MIADLTARAAVGRLLAVAVRGAAGLGLALAAQGAAALDGPTANHIRATGVVVIAHREAAIPFAYVDGSRPPIGYAIDLCARVVEALRHELKMPELRVRYVPVSSKDRIPAILSGKADMECGSSTNTASRRKQVAFSVVHFYASGRLLVRKDADIRSVSAVLDEPARQLVVNRGSTYATRMAEGKRHGVIKATIVEVNDVDEAFARLQNKQADAVLHDDVVLYALRAGAADPSMFQLLSEPLSLEAEAVMLRRDDPAFKRFVDIVLSHLMIDGEGEALYRRWFQSPIPPKGINLQLPLSPLLLDQLHYPSDKVGDEYDG